MADLTYSSLNNWLKFKHLVLLETLARTNNMHLAAEQMNLSQPAVSKMLKEIEGLLGFQVFERLPRNMPVTALGEHVIRYALNRSALLSIMRTHVLRKSFVH